MSRFKLSVYTVITDILSDNLAEQRRILYSTRTGMAVVLADEVIGQLQNGEFDAVSFNIIRKLQAIEVIVPAEEDEVVSVLNQNKAHINDLKSVLVVIQAGAACQLGCGYCGQKHSKVFMNEDLTRKMLQRIEGKILAKEKCNTLQVTWYGGEPLMALRQIREISGSLQALAQKHQIGYEADMITNGMSLKKDIFRELVTEHKLRTFQVTLDGTAEYHDKRRVTKEGGESFDIIFKNLVEICSMPDYKELGARITVRCNVDDSNAESVVPLLQLLAEHQLQDKINFYASPIHDWGNNDAEVRFNISKEDFANMEIDWFMEMNRLKFDVELMPSRIRNLCMAVQKDAEVYDAYGNISNCWETTYTPEYEDGRHQIGNLRFDEATYNENVPLRQWNDTVLEGKTWCKKCRFLPVCGGACPLHWESGHPPCPSYKFNMEDRLLYRYLLKSGKLDSIMSVEA
ncbi:MAG: SPASM domain-containing protein [Dinghuibacter sp.]|nr:SPASM domain-containing protein [Dinghuibacter sp.]